MNSPGNVSAISETESHRGEVVIGPRYTTESSFGEKKTRHLLLCPKRHVIGWTEDPESEAGRVVECRGN